MRKFLISSNSLTFKLLDKQRFKTLEDFCYDFSGDSLKYLALELMALWVPSHGESKYNFMKRYIHKTQDFSKFSVGFLDYKSANVNPVSIINVYELVYNYSTKPVLNLGALMFLNIFLNGKMTDNNLQIIEVNNSYYLIQNSYENFFLDFSNVINNFTLWDVESSSENKILQEILTTALRIYLTPDNLLELIIDSTLGPKSKFNKFFKNYLLNAKKNVLPLLYENLKNIDMNLIHNFKQQFGAQIMLDFGVDIEVFVSFYSQYACNNYLISTLNNYQNSLFYYFQYLKLNIFHRGSYIDLLWPADWLNIKNIEIFYPETEDINLENVVYNFYCILKIIQNNWQELSAFPDFEIWKYINSLADYIKNTSRNKVSLEKHLNSDFISNLSLFAQEHKFSALLNLLNTKHDFNNAKKLTDNYQQIKYQRRKSFYLADAFFNSKKESGDRLFEINTQPSL